MRLTEKQIIILEALARFKYLTSKQLQIIFTSKSTSAINTAIRSLKEYKYPLIKSLSFGITP
jgi:selenocysteine lyase/cysteine desulfurase